MSKKKTDFIQSGVIPIRKNKNNKIEICLITSREGKNLIVPKGLVEDGISVTDSALKEAWEEAGLLGYIIEGFEDEFKLNKWGRTFSVKYYIMIVESEKNNFEEADFRKKIWTSFNKAIKTVTKNKLRNVLIKAEKFLKENL